MNGNTSIGVLVVDDEPMVCRFLAEELEREPRITVLGSARDGAEAVEQVLRLQPDIVLMDLRMPGVDGISATEEITRIGPESRVIVLTTLEADKHVLAALGAGATGFVYKSAPPQQLISMVLTAAQGGSVLTPEALAGLVKRANTADDHDHRIDDLTPREHDVLALLADGLSNAQISGRLYISTGTVKAIISRLMTHLALGNRTQLALWFSTNRTDT